MTDDRHGEDTPQGGGRWDPLPQGDYDDGATAFVQLPEGGVDALLAADSPLAAPGHGYVPPPITVTPATTAGTDPAATGTWSVPSAPVDGAQWQDPDAGHAQPHAHPQQQHPYADAGQHAAHLSGGQQDPYAAQQGHDRQAEPPYPDPRTGPDSGQQHTGQQHTGQPHTGHDRFTYQPGATGQWNFEEAAAAEEAATAAAPGHDVTGQWSIPVAGGDLPDESGEFTTSSLVEQWGGTPPATLPGGAPAPWATQAAGQPWGHGTPAQPADAGPAHGQPAHHPGEQPLPGHPYEQQPVQAPAPEHPAPPYAEPPAGVLPEAPGPGGTAEAAGEAVEAAESPAEAPAQPPAAPDAETAPTAAEEPVTPDGSTAPEGTAPEATAPAPQETAPAPEETAPAAEETGPAPDETGPAPDEAAPAPDEAAPAPDEPAVAASADPADPADPETGPRQEPDSGPAPAGPGDEHPLASYVLRVNGTDRPVTDAWIGESLLYVLRERLGLAGAKDGCSQGECGACNVQVDGRLVASCLVPAVTAAGSEVRTVEGLATDGQPSDVQRALARCGAVQCGFCVPGMAMTVHDLLEGNPAPTELEARQALCGNLCRCSGYRGVLRAVQEVVGERAAHAAADSDGEEPRIPHQAGPGDGGVTFSAFESPGSAPSPGPHDQPYGQDGGQA
ncbi:hypothetical protein GCM10010129_14640 [Streptomyces fumigatiscleroticus]|nr:hypothetical protein GCM10010129_14640 [Streptomyces fumigatiscleroticus]